MIELSDIIAHARNREYMSGIERDELRVKATGEVFTPTPLVQEILNQLPNELFTDPSKTFLDPSCGDGQFLSEVLIKKLENGIDFETALSSIYGVDLMIDNVDLCRDRLLCGREDLRPIVEQNIVCHNSLLYKYKFGKPTKRQRINDNTKRRISANEQMLRRLADKESNSKKTKR
jgi:hypothetical protein